MVKKMAIKPQAGFMRAASAARYLGVSRPTFYKKVLPLLKGKEKKITGAIAVYRKEDIDAAVEQLDAQVKSCQPKAKQNPVPAFTSVTVSGISTSKSSESALDKALEVKPKRKLI
jgi:predicted DNA-binding transcriptional regulator AlpA